jgi:glutamyl-tRNA reductase
MSKQAREKTVAFVGLGQMGGPMAENLLKKGHAVVVYDIDKRKVARFVELGAPGGHRARPMPRAGPACSSPWWIPRPRLRK